MDSSLNFYLLGGKNTWRQKVKVVNFCFLNNYKNLKKFSYPNKLIKLQHNSVPTKIPERQ